MSLHQSHLTTSNRISDPTTALRQSHLGRNYKRADSDIQRLQFEIKKVKYPVLAIQPAEHLQTKISHFKNQKLQKQMKLKLVQDKHLNAYRKIRGDGNCFIRALAYSYLTNVKDLSDVKATFYQLEDIDLTVCEVNSIPKEFRQFYNDKLLKEILLNNWEFEVKHFKNLCKDNNKRIVSRLFRKSPFLDFIVILYFRSLCLKGLQKHTEQLKDFMKGTQLDQIKTYGEESQGVLLDICSRLFKVSIDVFEVRKQDINHYGYRNQKIIKDSFKVSLLYYENHYDIIQTIEPRLLQEENNDANIQEEEYYSKINQKMIEGNCIECGKDDYVYEENNLCDHCFQISKQQMLNSVKQDKWVRGVCRDCGRSGLKVLQMISLCEACTKLQAQVTEQNIKNSPPKKAQPKCDRCEGKLDQKDQCPKCSSIQIGMCIQCDKKKCIDKETKLCENCRNVQSDIFSKNQRKQEFLKKLCPDCKQPRDSSYHSNKCLKKTVQLCHFCNDTKDSGLHEMKCVKKLATAKISLPKTENSSFSDELKLQFQSRRCRKCKKIPEKQTLVSGWCKKCHEYFSAEDRHQKKGPSFGSGSIISQSSHSSQGQRPGIGGQMCRGCKNHFYITKLKDSYCNSCEPKYYRGYKF